jgi:hypothetical protein
MENLVGTVATAKFFEGLRQFKFVGGIGAIYY